MPCPCESTASPTLLRRSNCRFPQPERILNRERILQLRTLDPAVPSVVEGSAESVPSPKEQGRRDVDREMYRPRVQTGRVALQERQVRVDEPLPEAGTPVREALPERELRAWTCWRFTCT